MKTPPFVYILKLAATKKMADKKAILRQAAVDGCEELFLGFQLAFNNRRTFGLKAAPLIEVDQTLPQRELMQGGDFTWDDFLELVENLENNKLTAKETKQSLYHAAENSGILEWNAFYRPILMKNMKCGIKAKTVNSILEDFGVDARKYIIPIWKLIEPANNGLLTGNVIVEPSLGGTRIIAILAKEYNTVKLYGKTGRENHKYNKIQKSLEKLLPVIPESIVFDGNVIDKNFQSLMKNTDNDEKYYAIYDLLTLENFDAGYSPVILKDRKETLSDLQQDLREITGGLAYIVPGLLIDFDEKNAQKKLKEFYQESIASGFSKVIVKKMDVPYSVINNINWFFWKDSKI